MAIKEAVESIRQEWSLQSAQGLAIWFAKQAHLGYQCEMKAGATPIFTSFLTTWLRGLSEWLPPFPGIVRITSTNFFDPSNGSHKQECNQEREIASQPKG